MTDSNALAGLRDAEVIDSTGDKVGTVKQLFVTQDTNEPSWVTVNTGLFGTKETFIPLAEARREAGRITVPYEKSFIKDAPNIDEDGEITPEQENELYRYYGVSDSDIPGHGTPGQQGQAADGRHADRAGVAGAAGTAGVAGAAGRDRVADDRRDGLAGDQDRRGAVDGDASTTLHEERVNVGTERHETGRVRLRKYVVQDTEQVEVPVEREEVVLERTPASGNADGATLGEDEVEVTLSEERPVVNKETVATEDVSLGKQTVRDTETVRTEVGHEEVEIERDGDRNDLRDGRNDRR